jgi:hypothetical protein
VTHTRRDALRTGAALALPALAGCQSLSPVTAGTAFSEGFEEGFDWEVDAELPGGDVSAFGHETERSDERAAAGDWSLRLFTEGDRDGTAWAVRPVEVPADAESFAVTASAWSPSESFETIRHLVMRLGQEPPEAEAEFPDPGVNSAAVSDAPYGGLREPLHLAAGWRDYGFSWMPADLTATTLYLAVGVSVVRETAATHFVDEIEVEV